MANLKNISNSLCKMYTSIVPIASRLDCLGGYHSSFYVIRQKQNIPCAIEGRQHVYKKTFLACPIISSLDYTISGWSSKWHREPIASLCFQSCFFFQQKREEEESLTGRDTYPHRVYLQETIDLFLYNARCVILLLPWRTIVLFIF